MSFRSVLFLLSVLRIGYGSVDLGKFLKICDRNAVDVNDCLVEAIQKGIVSLAGGLKELGVPPLDPNHEKEIRIVYQRNQIYVRMSMKDINVEGLKKSTVHDASRIMLDITAPVTVTGRPEYPGAESYGPQSSSVSQRERLPLKPLVMGRNMSSIIRLKNTLRADEDQFHLEVDMTTPRVFVQGNYFGEGRFNSLTFNATGMFNTTMTDLVYTWKLDGVPEKRDNETYVRINSFYMRPDLGSLVSYLSNDIPESQPIIQLANNFANSNWRPLYRELLPYAQANWNKIGIKVANKLFLKVPYDKMFPV